MANENTLTFSEKNKGWTSFHSWFPSLMGRVNNKFFSVKDGQLYEHHDRTNPNHNEFYGVKYPSTITQVINEANMEDKIFKNLILEGNLPWTAFIRTNMTEGLIHYGEFNNRESKWFSYTRQNEEIDDLTDRVQGIGSIVSVVGSDITFAQMPTLVSVGETLYQLNGVLQEEIGVIDNIVDNTITVNAIVTAPTVSNFAYSVKDPRVQGSEIRGYFAEVTLENDDNEKVELFAISSNIVRSYAPTNYQ